jgi:hypothetical protein
MGTNIHDIKKFYGAKRRLSRTLVDSIKVFGYGGLQLLAFNLRSTLVAFQLMNFKLVAMNKQNF